MCLAIPGEILTITDENVVTRTGRVSFNGVVKEINLTLVPEAGVGDWVIVHVGFAISRLDEAEAKQTLRYLDEIEAEAAKEDGER